MTIAKEYIVETVESFLGGVVVSLKPLNMPQVNLEVIRKPQNEDERVAQNMVLGAVQAVKQLMPAPEPMFRPPSPFTVKVWLSVDEYEKLCKPTVNDTIHMQLVIKTEG